MNELDKLKKTLNTSVLARKRFLEQHSVPVEDENFTNKATFSSFFETSSERRNLNLTIIQLKELKKLEEDIQLAQKSLVEYLKAHK